MHRKGICAENIAMRKLVLFIVLIVTLTVAFGFAPSNEEKKHIEWVDCNVPYEVLKKAYELDVKYHNSDIDYDFEKALAYLGVKNGNKFSAVKDCKALVELESKLKCGKKIEDFYGGNKYYKYYEESYNAIFSQFIGEYTNKDGKEVYGLKNFHPIAKGFWYNHYDDFGSSRSYGFKRVHLGHDIMGSVGTPIIAVEGGTITDFGWNRYGGWRIGIRSFDGLRSYYYAHLRKNHPYYEGLKSGDTIKAGQVIGYLGVTGYSFKENSNMKCKPHLHIGMQLIFHESQIKGPKEIWIDMYQISKFLSLNRIEVIKSGDEYKTIYNS